MTTFQFEDFSSEYDRLWKDTYGDVQRYGPTHFHTLRLCQKLLSSLSFNSVLDVGCGPGHNLGFLKKINSQAQVCGIDISEECIKTALSQGLKQFFKMDIQREHLSEKFDLLFCCYLLEHLENDTQALLNMRAMTEKYILITTVLGNFERYQKTEKLFGHVRNYQQQELKKKVEAAGFRPISILQWGFPFYSPIFRNIINISPSYSTGKFGIYARIAAKLLRTLFYLNSSRSGDIIIILASV